MYYRNYLLDYIIGTYLWLIVFIAILWFIIHILVAKQFESYANDKGYNGSKIFWICFFIMPLGIAMVWAMPDRKTRDVISKLNISGLKSKEEIKDSIPKCRYCGTPIKENAKYCVKCGNRIE